MPQHNADRNSAPRTDTVNHYWDCTGGSMPRPRQIKWTDHTAPHGIEKKSGLPIIGRRTPINHGVWISNGEFLVIDDSGRREKKIYGEVMSSVERRIEKVSEDSNYKLPVDSALRLVADSVRRVIPWDPERAKSTDYAFGGNPLQLSYFIEGKWGGVCRHQAALGGYICEKLAQKGVIEAETFLNRNRIDGPEGPGHAWVRLEGRSSDLVYILDTTQDAIGVIDDMGDDHWPYRQPTDTSIYSGDNVE